MKTIPFTPIKKPVGSTSAATTRNAFTLVELSLVLVIIALVIGGVMAGQSLIRAAEIRAATAQYKQYVHAIDSFRDKYKFLPGDMPTATNYWGAQHATPATCTTTASTGVLTCNGNGNGKISSMGTSEEYEAFRFWQHLSNAGFIDGRFTGVRGSLTTRHAVIGQNVPAAKVTGAGFSITYYDGSTAGHSTRFLAESYKHQFNFGGQTDIRGGYETYEPMISPTEARNIDLKLDDGMPGTGNILGWKNGGDIPLCTTTTSPTTSQYNLTNTTKACNLILLLNL